ncbi:2-phospho-L-lactate transferase [Leucobacter weissii]|uniref:2-phospho-L-lactate transferase n=1 Tax=Leucobacter weissii TaxID=1983706 RepID=A0A939MIW6_9MICO|nr:2-phospho-L-lactate transferase [Leucobacter weissii]MBO1901411.1 2-phospho-L-lactate transferase [Leucobacter weissii]
MTTVPRITVLTGGVGGAKFIVGLRNAFAARFGERPDSAITAIVNTGDDLWLSGLRLQPDIDSVMYALAGINDRERGWGRKGESEVVSAELRGYGAAWPWFVLGDLDLGAHIARTGWLREGWTVSQVASKLAARWDLGARILPMTDTEVDTEVVVRVDGTEHSMHFQEWWTRYRGSMPALAFENPGIDRAEPSAGVIDALSTADAILLAPSNPVVSIGPILRTPGIREAVVHSAAPVLGISPIIGGRAVRGMADTCLRTLGVDVSADGVAAHYGTRTRGGLLDHFLIDDADAALAPLLSDFGLHAHVRSIWMRDEAEATDLAAAVLGIVSRS